MPDLVLAEPGTASGSDPGSKSPSMKSSFRLILFFIVTIAVVVLLAASLSGTTFAPGKPFPITFDDVEIPQSGAPAAGGEAAFNLFRLVYFAIWLLIPILLVYLIISPQARKALLRQVLRALPFILLLLAAGRYLQNMAANQGEQEIEGSALLPPDFGEAYPIPRENFVAAAPEWAVWSASLALAVLIVVVFLFVMWLFWRKRQKDPGIERIAEEAQTALEAIESGSSLRNVVMRCYFEMSEVLSETRGIKRDTDLTPQEFQARLVEKGLPREPVYSLTALFEEVRYGTKSAGKAEEQRAVDSLTAIVNFCRGYA